MADRLRQRNTVILLVSIVFGMLILSFASVPLYRLFCQKTGYGGTPKIVDHLSSRIVKRPIQIMFNSDVSPMLPWRFVPLQGQMTLNLGELGLAFYEVTNRSNAPMTGIAVYNVTPDKAAPYFHKISCFCFADQTIPNGRPQTLPVQFYIDPSLDDDPQLKDVRVITLSYTFYHFKENNLLKILGLPTSIQEK